MSSPIYLYSAFRNTHSFKAALTECQIYMTYILVQGCQDLHSLAPTLIKHNIDPTNQVLQAKLKTTWFVCWSRIGTKLCRATKI